MSTQVIQSQTTLKGNAFNALLESVPQLDLELDYDGPHGSFKDDNYEMECGNGMLAYFNLEVYQSIKRRSATRLQPSEFRTSGLEIYVEDIKLFRDGWEEVEMTDTQRNELAQQITSNIQTS